jgi:hypothetical protein
MAPKSCNNIPAVNFVKKHRPDCEPIASDLQVPVENILGLAAQESQYGNGRIARDCNNYFSMHAPAPLQIGEEPAQKDPKVKVAKFSSFAQSAMSFKIRYGNAVKGKKDALAFGKALVKAGFNSGDAASGGRTGFAEYLADIIKMVKERMACR